MPSYPRITVNKTELALIRAGLVLINGRLSGASAGCYPHRHPLDRIDFRASAVYLNQKYDKEMADRIVALSHKLATDPCPRKVRLDAFEAAAARLALRVTCKKSPWNHPLVAGTGAAPAERVALLKSAILKLEKKLENCRRRAKRVAIVRLSQSVYDEHFKRWQAFVQWVRYNLLYDAGMPIVRRLFTRSHLDPTRQMWKYQRLTLLEMAREVVTERTTAVIPEDELYRLVRLAKEELRRARHEVTLMQAIGDRKKGKEMLFKFIQKRFELDEHIRFEFADPSVQQSTGCEKFSRARFPSEGQEAYVPPTQQPRALEPASARSGKALGTDDHRARKPTEPAVIVPSMETAEERKNLVAAGKAIYIPGPDIIREIASLLREHLLPQDWDRFLEKAVAKVSRLKSPLPVNPVRSVEFFTLQGLFGRSRPGKPPQERVQRMNYLVDWIIKVMTVLYRTSGEIRKNLEAAVHEANRQVNPWAWGGW